jgi:hypothetical protein
MAFALSAAAWTAIAVGVGTAGQLYSSNKASKSQQKAANIQNARERRQQLKAIRMAQRDIEFQGQRSGTGGGSAQAQAAGSVATTGAANIGAQMQTIASANQISHWNRVGSGFGALAQVGQTMASPDMYLGKQKGVG